MNDEEYELEVLLELRENEVEQAREAYAEEIRELERRRNYVESLTEELEQLLEERASWREEFDDRKLQGTFSPGEARRYEQYLRGLEEDADGMRAEIERAEAAICNQEERVEAARSALEEALCELEALERHREDWEERREEVARRKAAERMDEIASRIWREEQT